MHQFFPFCINFSLNFRSNWTTFSLVLYLIDPSFLQNFRSDWVHFLTHAKPPYWQFDEVPPHPRPFTHSLMHAHLPDKRKSLRTFLHCFHVCGVILEIIWGVQTPPYFTPSSLFTLICLTFTLNGSMYETALWNTCMNVYTLCRQTLNIKLLLFVLTFHYIILNIQVFCSSCSNKYALYRLWVRFHDFWSFLIMPALDLLAHSSMTSHTSSSGDFNIDLLKLNDIQVFSEYFDMLTSHSCYPTIALPTWLSNIHGTLIDNFLCKLIETTLDTTYGILINILSDHQPYFTFWIISNIMTIHITM